MPKRINALILFSGGLDSILSVKLLQKQRIKVTGLVFVSYFFNSQLATKAAKKLKIKLKIVNFSEEHFKIVKKPEYGYGKAMNPCIDCHLLMLKKAKKIMEDSVRDEKFDFIATGEVLGERPMSQNRQALELIERESGLKGYLLRPLSAKLLEPTVAEKKGLVNRDKFLDISGRSRKRQMALAKKWKIKEYPTPAGGCLLTDPQFGQRLKELLEKWPKAQGNDVELLKLGRHFWATPAPEKTQRGVESNKIIVGRNKEENKKIKKLAQKGDLVIEPRDFPGPTVLIRSKNKLFKESLAKAKELMIKHSPKLRRKLGIDK
ncbi:MAG: tRNA 4-thiouridine(8) synthase ThiI [Candidatus Portnoybacteria bacterium CG03_land_8_20_14_0_80_41_10]|uniref:tRNA 4-thiouridine(8) synthase ThiI n=1 Tax=Candidatus Portnoybacteria bacterium CG03_land_8_20_14_0_80_41_10 TaxID=1974808 RepID=A0A2M7BVC5_9BACT|nr:MAG: tRNA 4-thiouridine(8) synthase ThiI [Candidatus Portnoybacteria bacterium CG03_land_8_20_14_0_80_41_10]